MSSAQYLIDAATRHQVFLQRYGGGQSKDAIKTLNRLNKGILARLAKEPTEFQAQRLKSVLKDVKALTSPAFKEISNNLISGSKDLAVSEAAFSAGMLDAGTKNANFTIPADELLIANVLQSTMDTKINSAITIQDALKGFSKSKQKQIAQIITDGVTLGDTTKTISKTLGETIDTLQKNQLDALARTITNQTSSIARKEVYSANSDIMDGYRWVSTLDSRTTLICGGRDGQRYPNETGFSPYPPAHWNCRSTTIPVILPEFDIGSKIEGDRPFRGADGKGNVSGRTTYGGWLKTQPKGFIDEALGKERSALFRSGKLTIDKFTDPLGKVYTLSELESLNPVVFSNI